jgi:hypothetical protein
MQLVYTMKKQGETRCDVLMLPRRFLWLGLEGIYLSIALRNLRNLRSGSVVSDYFRNLRSFRKDHQRSCQTSRR